MQQLQEAKLSFSHKNVPHLLAAELLGLGCSGPGRARLGNAVLLKERENWGRSRSRSLSMLARWMFSFENPQIASPDLVKSMQLQAV